MTANENKTNLSRKEKTAETKKQIFDAALDLLDERPFEDITIRDIVARANVSIGTFYNYYMTKQDCYYETYIFADAYFENTVKPELESLSSTHDKVLRFFYHYAKYSSELTDLRLTKILYNGYNTCFDRSSNVGMLPILTSVFKEGLTKGDVHSEKEPAELALYFMFAARGLCYNWCTRDGAYNLITATEDYVKFLLQTVE